MAKVTGVVEFFTPGLKGKTSKKGKVNEQDGFIISLADGTRTPLQGAGLDPAVIAQLKEDNIFEYDVLPDPTGGKPSSMMAANFIFVRTEAGATAKAKTDFPAKAGKGAGAAPATTAVVVSPVVSADLTEPYKLEVHGRPIGGDLDNRWEFTFEVENSNLKPLEGIRVAMETEFGKIEGPTTKDGCFSGNLVITKDTYGYVRLNSVLSIPNIPLAGPELPPPPPKEKTGFRKWDNKLFVGWTILMLVFLFGCIFSAYSEFKTTYEQKAASVTLPSTSKSVNTDGPKYSTRTKSAETAEKVQKYENETTHPGRILFIFIFIVWLILIPVCFWDEMIAVATKAYYTGKEGIEGLYHRRKPFSMAVQINRTAEGSAEAVYSLNGKLINQPEKIVDKAKGMASIGFWKIIGLMFTVDGIAELVQLIWKKIVGGEN